MLSESVRGITSPIASSETALAQSIPTDDTYPQQTLRAKKRDGSAELVDVTKIVRAIGR
jgi:hypothetical protein